MIPLSTDLSEITVIYVWVGSKNELSFIFCALLLTSVTASTLSMVHK